LEPSNAVSGYRTVLEPSNADKPKSLGSGCDVSHAKLRKGGLKEYPYPGPSAETSRGETTDSRGPTRAGDPRGVGERIGRLWPFVGMLIALKRHLRYRRLATTAEAKGFLQKQGEMLLALRAIVRKPGVSWLRGSAAYPKGTAVRDGYGTRCKFWFFFACEDRRF
jgi:hypothetical protein